MLFVFVGLQFFALGLIGEYIGRIYREVRKRPEYVIERIYGDEEPERPAKEGLQPMRVVVLAYHNMGIAGLDALLRSGYEIACVLSHEGRPERELLVRVG